MIQLKAIDHVVFRVTNLPAMLHFYCKVLGCTFEREEPEQGLYQLRAGTSLIDLVPLDKPLGKKAGGPPNRNAPNVDHVCLQVDPFDGAAICAFLAEQGIACGPIEQRYGAKGFGPSIYLQDPEGNTL
ncbi:MAG: VOC family protein, partial [Limnobacter sp.]|nr:VOC family protein [Limnobacter sp.]